jgi:hypothetical protein
MADPAKLARGDWGLLHELGHNHQVDDWTFDGVGEVTNNVICLYVLETVCGRKPPAAGAEPGDLFRGVAEGAKEMAPYFARAPSSRSGSSSLPRAADVPPGAAGLRWKVFHETFNAYRGMPPREAEERRRQARPLARHPLPRLRAQPRPFFTAWGVPTSDAARASVAALPEWMPESFPPK